MRLAYGELIGGISGDMFVAALIDLGLPLAKLRSELKKIPTLQFELKTAKKLVHSVRASQIQVICPKHEAPRSWQQIRRLIERSKLDSAVSATGLKIFTRLAEAEARIHDIAPEQVHFHEIGATDSIVDIMAAAIGIHSLGIDKLQFSRIPLGRGVTRSQHGPLPLPAPATLELLKGLPLTGVDVEGETVTPTGAAIIRTLGERFGDRPAMTIAKIGYGAGHKEFLNHPNLFRLSIGALDENLQREEMSVLETNIDDMNPQYYDHVMARLFAAGAREVFLAPVQMKKNRPGIVLTVICQTDLRDHLAAMILQETSSIGVRYYPVRRLILSRRTKKITTRFGTVTVKLVEQPDGTSRAAPEYDELKRLANAKKLPIAVIYNEVMRRGGQ